MKKPGLINKTSLLPYFFIVLYLLVFSTLSILKHQALHSTYLDLGLQSQSIWNTSQGRILEISFGENGELFCKLGDHVGPIAVLFAPFYWVWADPILLLVFQTLILALGAFPVYWLAKDVLGKTFLPLAFAVSYLLYPPTQYANLFDFHPETLATTLLLFTFWFLYKKQYKSFLLFAFLSVLCKEDIALVVAMMGVYEVFRNRHYKLLRTCGPNYKGLKEAVPGIFVFLFSVFWFVLCVCVIMPHFSGGEMGAVSRYGWLGETPSEIVKNFILHPVQDLKFLLMMPKIKYVFHLLVSAGFLPLLAPQYLALALPEFWLNLFSEYNPMWQVKFHYTSAITPFVFIAGIFGAKFLLYLFYPLSFRGAERRGNLEGSGISSRLTRSLRSLAMTPLSHRSRVLSVYLIIISLFWNFMHSPSPLYRKFDPEVFKVTPEARQTREILKQIPQDASVSAMNNLGAHLSTRRYLYRFPIGINEADYIVVDPRMPAENFDYAQISEEEFEELMSSPKIVGPYERVLDLGRLLILKKKP